MKLRPLVSIIIPIYNQENYLTECLDSISGQTYKQIDIICVNDGSTDNSLALLRDYGIKDERIKIVDKKNDGVNMARKSGWDIATGDYVTFLDPDDFLDRSAIEQSVSILEKRGADIVAFGYREFSDTKRPTTNEDGVHIRPKDLQGKSAIAKYAFFGEGNSDNVLRMTIWGKLYKREVIEKVDWKAVNYNTYEDNFWIAQALLAAEKLTIYPAHLYNYRRNFKYQHAGQTLSGMMVGIQKNGKSVGYLEQVEQLYNYEYRLAKKYNIFDLQDRLLNKYYGEMLWRIDSLSNAKLLAAENNLEYFYKIWKWYREDNARVHKIADSLWQENQDLHGKINSHLSIKRSAKLLMGNVKRRIRVTIKGNI